MKKTLLLLLVSLAESIAAPCDLIPVKIINQHPVHVAYLWVNNIALLRINPGCTAKIHLESDVQYKFTAEQNSHIVRMKSKKRIIKNTVAYHCGNDFGQFGWGHESTY